MDGFYAVTGDTRSVRNYSSTAMVEREQKNSCRVGLVEGNVEVGEFYLICGLLLYRVSSKNPENANSLCFYPSDN